jgi:DNA-binding NarL/FixJ family response regulator
MIKVLIADDHPIVRIGMKHVMEEDPEITIADEASDGDEALDKILNNNFDLVLLDISMPGKDGLDVLKQIKKEKPNLPVLILSIYPEEEFAIRALKTGASGYLTKKSAPYELTTAIRTVLQGKKYISSSMVAILASYLEVDPQKKPHERLSNREYQVMLKIASGKNVAEIAEELSLNIKTIRTFRTRIMKKMKIKNDVELSRYATQNHLLE